MRTLVINPERRVAASHYAFTNVRALRTFAQAIACLKGESEPATIIISFLETIDSCCREEVEKWFKQGILYSAQGRTCGRLDSANVLD